MSLPRTTALALIAGALFVNVPYALLVTTFDYPDVLRRPAGEILASFTAGGPWLILLWLAFAWAGAPLLFGVHQLPRALYGDVAPPWTRLATALGLTGLIVQIVGLLRWVFVVPVLARIYLDPASTEAERAAARVGFELVHAYGGVTLGEHLGQALTIAWMVLLLPDLWRTRVLPRAVVVLGAVASFAYALAQGELFATVIPGFPEWGPAGLVGSLLWLAFAFTLGATLLRATPSRPA